MSDWLTTNAMKAMVAALESAHSRQSEYIGAEDLLLGILRLPDSEAVRSLGGAKKAALIEKSVLEGRKWGKEPVALPDSPLGPSGTRALVCALAQAGRHGRDHVGTEHLLLGVIKTKTWIAKLLEELGVQVEVPHQEVKPRTLQPRRTRKRRRRTKASIAVTLTSRAMEVLDLARKEAKVAHREYVGTEHLLLGLAQRRHAICFGILREMRVDARGVRGVLRKGPGSESNASPGHNPRLSSRARRVLELAFEEAVRLGYEDIGTAHLLLSLSKETDGTAAQVFVNLGVKREDLETRMMEILRSDHGWAEVERDDRPLFGKEDHPCQ